MSSAPPRRSRNERASAREKAAGPAGRHGQEIERLKRENERLREELIKRDRQIADLERQLALRQQNSTTSSKPPSSDGLAGRQRERGRRTKSRRVAEGRAANRAIRATVARWSPSSVWMSGSTSFQTRAAMAITRLQPAGASWRASRDGIKSPNYRRWPPT